MRMNEVGGYLELDSYSLPMLHDGEIALNCGRNALAWLIRAREIKKILLPKFLCSSVEKICLRERTKVRYYSIDEKFLPINISLLEGEWLYLVNYYGQLTDQQIGEFAFKYKNIILDQTQAYFQIPLGEIDTIYSCRKYFGVPDGAFLHTNAVLNEVIPQDESWQRMTFLLGRYERAAQEFYGGYAANNELFESEPIKEMSKLTRNLLHGIDYGKVRDIRTENYLQLHGQLKTLNRLELRAVEGAFMYPLYIDNGTKVRKKLCDRGIYVPTLWPEVIEKCGKNELERRMAENILPLPCDQRYRKEDMDYVVESVMECL